MIRLALRRRAFGIGLLALATVSLVPPLLAEPLPQIEGPAAVQYLRDLGLYDAFREALLATTDRGDRDQEPSSSEAITFTQQGYLKASNTAAGDFFGVKVAISGDTLVVGAKYEDSSTTGVNGNQNDNLTPSAGAAYVFARSGTSWSQQAYLKASNTGANDLFGSSVAISGNTIVVGARGEGSNATGVNGNQSDNSMPNAGAVYVFVRAGTTWAQQAYLKASNTDAEDLFGYHVAISGDTIVVGSPYEASSATGINGNQSDNSAAMAGAVYVFVRSGTSWSQQAYLKASNTGGNDLFGLSVAVSGNTIVVGAGGERSAATGVNGNQSDNSLLHAGAAYVFVRSGPNWSQQAYLKASNTGDGDRFGETGMGITGDTIVIGAQSEDSSATGVDGNQSDNSASGAGAAYVFVRSGTHWSQQAYLKASNTGSEDHFATNVAISGDTLVIGTEMEDSNATGINGNQSDNSAPSSGAAYVFTRSGSTWSQLAYLKASNTNAGDYFGPLAISGDTIVVGAFAEDSAASGINGNQADNSAAESGAAYVLRFGTEIPPPPAGPWLATAALPGYRFKVLIGSDRAGTQVADCVPETLCVAGAIPTRSELFVRLIGPRPNDKIWAQAIRFTISQVELWVEQTPSAKVNYYLLEALPSTTDVLTGINDSLAFDP